MAVLDFLILMLATWRTSSLLADEEGPFGFFEKIRGRIGIIYMDDGDREGKNELARTVLCTWCSTLFLSGLFWAVLFYIWGQVVILIALPFALSTGSIYVDRFIWRGSKYKRTS